MEEIILIIGFLSISVILINNFNKITKQLLDHSRLNRAIYDKQNLIQEEIRITRELLELIQCEKLKTIDKSIRDNQKNQFSEVIKLASDDHEYDKENKYYDYTTGKMLLEYIENNTNEAFSEMLNIEKSNRIELKELILEQRSKQKQDYERVIKRMDSVVRKQS